ncbi:MAG: aminotransferase class V-fold PLP-dependent enzyme [Pseudomonadota bacterium]
MSSNREDPRPALGLRPIINVSGTMTHLGASIIVPEAVAAMADIAPEFVEMPALHKQVGEAIARLCGAEAGTATACVSAGITLAVAAAMTGDDPGHIEQLPDTTGMKNEVVIQIGHMVNYGHPLEQGIRLAGATVKPAGQVTRCKRFQLEAAITEATAAAIYVVSHHTVQYGQLPLAEFCEICHARSVPVIVDAASEYDLRGFLEAGADLALYSGHKFLGGPTSGMVAGARDLVQAVYLQNFGIGRGMKTGKETLRGLMAAIEAWEARNHDAVRARETGYLELWQDRLRDIAGIRTELIPDPTNNPLDRLRLHVDPAAAGITSWDLASSLAQGDPPVIVRNHQVECGFFDMDPCNLHPGEADTVARRLLDELGNSGR